MIIDANENPLGPCSVAREAIADITSDSGRYSLWLTEDLAKRFAEQQGLKPEYVHAFPFWRAIALFGAGVAGTCAVS